MHVPTAAALAATFAATFAATNPAPALAQSGAALPAVELTAGRWGLMLQGSAFGQFDRQWGTRGGTQVGSLTWGMLMATHGLAGGELTLRTMLSLDPAGVTGAGYPLLLQSGEEYRGQQVHDRQHPHDAVMELAASWRRALSRSLAVSLYAAPVGEPALGPVAFMMRPSALDNPEAPIGHHWQDATHVSFGVLTAAVTGPRWTLEGSWFNGREPDDRRWSFDPIRLDSWSARLTVNPTDNWSAAWSYGVLASPDAAADTISVRRMTASVTHGATMGGMRSWNSTLLWGANLASDRTALSNSVLLESELQLDDRYSVFVRAEFVQKTAEELVLVAAPWSFAPARVFDVGELSVGGVRELARWKGASLGIGVLATVNLVPASLRAAYGSTTPVGGMVFLHVRPSRTVHAMRSMPGMEQMPPSGVSGPADPHPQSPP